MSHRPPSPESAAAGLAVPRDAEWALLADVFRRSPAFAAVLEGPRHVFRLANDRYLELVGGRDVVGKPVRQALPEIEGQGFFELLDRVYATGEPYVGRDVVVLVERLPGHPLEERVIEFVYQPTHAPGGAVSGVLVHGVDLTEHRRAAAAVRESEERFRVAFDQAVVGMVLADPAGRVLRVNDAFCRIVGRAADDLLARDSTGYTHPDDRGPSAEQVRRVADGSAPGAVYEKRYVLPGGRVVWTQVSVSPTRDGGGRPEGLIAVVQDVTDRRVTAEQLARKATLLANVRDSVIVTDLSGVVTYWNDGATRLFGWAADEMLGLPYADRLPEPARSEVAAWIAKIAGGGGEFEGEWLDQRKDGSTVWIEALTRRIAHPDGTPAGIMGVARDVSDRRRAAEALRESEERFRAMADSAPVLVWLAGPDKACYWFNQAWVDFTGRTLAQERGDGWTESVHPDDVGLCRATYAGSFDRREPFRMDYRLRRRDGQWRWVLDHGVPRFGPEGAFSGYIGSCVDITDLKRAEVEREAMLGREQAARAAAEHASRMKDEFLATLSHELRTPLNAILGWSQIVRRAGADPATLAEGLDTIERNARAQAQIIEDLLDMSRIISGKVRLDVRRLDPGDVVRAAIDTCRPAAVAKGIRVQAVLDPRAGPVNGDPGRLQQVFWNLLSNAVKFTPRGGRVGVRLARVDSRVEVEVTDSGEGISPEFLPFVFDRFRQADASTTRRHGGLGLGLAIVKQLVESHGGTVRVRSGGAGAGTTFTVALPVPSTLAGPEGDAADARADDDGAAPPAEGAPHLPLGGVDVLVVDDEADARALVRRVLTDCGASVRLAGSAAEALAQVASRRPDVLVCDIGMPGEDGYALIRRVRGLGPGAGGDVPAVALTAYARTSDRVGAIRAGFQMHMAKPVEPSELAAAVASLAGRIRA